MRQLLICSLCLIATIPAHAAPPPDATQPPPNLTILTGNHISRPLVPLARAYARQQHVAITSARVTGAIEEQISQGLEAHLLLTADKTLVSRLTDRGLTDISTSGPFARSNLVLATTQRGAARMELAKHISFAAMIAAAPDLPIFLEPETDVAGNASAGLLKGYEFSDALKSRATLTTSHSQLLSALRETGGLALMLASDAASEPDIVVLTPVPETLVPAIPFYAVVLASESMERARNFAHYLSSPAALNLLTHAGFEALQTP